RTNSAAGRQDSAPRPRRGSPMNAAEVKQYLDRFLPGVKKALQLAVGQPPDLVRDEKRYRALVSDAGWYALPPPLRKPGRDRIRWDELLDAARKEVFIA